MQSNLVPQSDLPTQSGSNIVPESDLPKDFETPGQQAITALEGAGQGVAGPLSTLAETKLLGVKPEDIESRAKANPIAHGAGQAAGLVGGALIPGVGEYTLGTKIAEAGSAAAKLVSNQVGKAAIKAASEMALIQASDETSKWLQNDPNQTIQSAIANIGLSAALGGAGGAVFGKIGKALGSLGKDPEGIVKGLKLNLDPLKLNEPLFPKEIPSKLPNKAVVESEGIGNRIGQAIQNHAANAGLEGLGAGVGAGIGHATGIPGAGWIGAYLGKEHIAPVLKSIIPALGKRIMDMEASGSGFVAAVNAAEQAIKGRILLEKAANSVFQAGMDIKLPSKEDKAELDAKVRSLQNDPNRASAAIDNKLGHYMPDHAMSLGQTVGNAVGYLNTQRPNTEKQSPLDSTPIPNKIDKSQYDRALTIAQQPLAVLNSIKEGNLTSTDIKHLVSMYPALYEQMKMNLMNSMVNHLSKGKEIPYKTRLGISLFTGQPLDSSMKPMSILASQPAPQQIPGGAPGVKNVKHSTASLNKMAQMDATPLQASEARKLTKG